SNSATSYNGFIDPVTVKTVNGNVVTTTTDGANNSITWTSDIYGQEYLPGGTTTSLPNAYEFPLLLDANSKLPVMPGNPLFTNFHIQTDNLIFDITAADFRALEGLAS